MVQLLLRLHAPPGRSPQAVQALRSVMLPVRLDRGNVRAQLSADVENTDVLYYVEEWPAADDLVAEIRSPRFARLLALMETAAEAPTLEFRFVSEVRGLEYVEEARGQSRSATGP